MRAWSITLAVLLALSSVACGRDPGDVAAAAGTQSLNVPVGPIPGPGKAAELPTNPYSQDDSVALRDGRTYFVRYNCYGCHGGRAGGGMGPSLRDEDWRYGSEDANVFDSIAQGRGMGMPAWASRLTAEQIWKIVAYIHSLRTSREPNPPPA